jgi:hypothetical protein
MAPRDREPLEADEFFSFQRGKEENDKDWPWLVGWCAGVSSHAFPSSTTREDDGTSHGGHAETRNTPI